MPADVIQPKSNPLALAVTLVLLAVLLVVIVPDRNEKRDLVSTEQKANQQAVRGKTTQTQAPRPVPALSPPRPDRFTDALRFPAFEASEDRRTRARAEQAFNMIRIPGDASRGIQPFYLSQTEVRLGMFYPWATGIGLVSYPAELDRRAGAGPSVYLYFYMENQYLHDDDYPALATGRVSAEVYCEWLSKQTGRKYRLPTQE